MHLKKNLLSLSTLKSVITASISSTTVALVTFLLNPGALFGDLEHQTFQIEQKPKYELYNSDKKPNILPGVAYHPAGNHIALTHFRGDRVTIYRLSTEGEPILQYDLKNPEAQLNIPHGVVFSPDGTKLVIGNYGKKNSINIYDTSNIDNEIMQEPISTFELPTKRGLKNAHGVTVSPDGTLIAVTHCDKFKRPSYEQGITLYRFDQTTATIDPTSLKVFSDSIVKEGNPKGIAFTPDGTHLAVTLGDSNEIVFYNISNKASSIFKSDTEHLSEQLKRPEDIEFSKDGKYCVVTNSDSVLVYQFDRESNSIIGKRPIALLENPAAKLSYPHGVAISPDQKTVAITHFGIKSYHGKMLFVTPRQDKLTMHTIH